MKYIIAIFLLLVFFACKKEKKEVIVPVIYLNPDEAGEMKTTDYFDNYEVVALKGVLCNSVNDVVEYPDRWIVSLDEGANKYFLYAYDKQGNPLFPIGTVGRGPGEYIAANKEVCLGLDSTIIVIDPPVKELKFSKEGEVLHEKMFEKDFNYGRLVYDLNDSTLLFYSEYFYMIIDPGRKEQWLKSVKGKYLLNIVPTCPSREVSSYFEAEEILNYLLHDQMYIFQDTCCFFIEKAGEVYNVSEKGIVPRYRLDRGKHQGFQITEEVLAGITTSKILMWLINETNKYVIGSYQFQGRYYIFIYDKVTQQTRNYKTVDDDLLKVGTSESKHFPSAYFTIWLGKRNFNQDGMIFLIRPEYFADMIEYIQGKMSQEEWKQYCDEHPDLIRVYNELNEDTSVVILKYKYK